MPSLHTAQFGTFHAGCCLSTPRFAAARRSRQAVEQARKMMGKIPPQMLQMSAPRYFRLYSFITVKGTQGHHQVLEIRKYKSKFLETRAGRQCYPVELAKAFRQQDFSRAGTEGKACFRVFVFDGWPTFSVLKAMDAMSEMSTEERKSSNTARHSFQTCSGPLGKGGSSGRQALTSANL